MSRDVAIAKLAKAAALRADAERLSAEALAELEGERSASPRRLPVVTDEGRRAMRRRLRAKGLEV